MKVWITKYALTKGIYSEEAELRAAGNILIEFPGGYLQFFGDGEWHRTKSAAIAKAKEMITKELAFIKERISRLRAITFE